MSKYLPHIAIARFLCVVWIILGKKVIKGKVTAYLLVNLSVILPFKPSCLVNVTHSTINVTHR